MKKPNLLLSLIMLAKLATAQSPEIEWQNTIGGHGNDYLRSVIQTTDGGYLLGGFSLSGHTGDKTEANMGSADYWIVKVDPSSIIEWQNTIGGSEEDYLESVIQTTDGGYLLGGHSYSGISGDKTEGDGGYYNNDYWIVKVDALGTIEWQNTIGGSQHDYFFSVIQTADGGYLLGGYSNSGISGDKTEANIAGYDYWIVKLDASGAIDWQNTIGGGTNDYLYCVIQTTDGGYLLGGYSYSGISGDKTEGNNGDADYWIVKVDSSGTIEWQKTIGGDDFDGLYSVIQTTDGGYLLGGFSESGISADKTEANIGYEDYWIVKVDDSGSIEWQNTIGGNSRDYLRSIIQNTDGEYLLGGYSDSGLSGDKTEDNIDGYDYWIVKVDASGTINGQNTIGGGLNDYLYSVIQTTDGGYLLGGTSGSGISGDKTENSHGYDYWIVKHDCIFSTFYADNDGDGFGYPSDSIIACTTPVGYASNNLDCDDTNSLINPGASELCNGLDDNCNGLADEDLTMFTYYLDSDSDGFGDNSSVITTCLDTPPDGFVTNNTDCNDTLWLYTDADGDGFGTGASVACGVPDNTDCDDYDAFEYALILYYEDADGDGFGNVDSAELICDIAPPGYVVNGADCDDTNADIYPGATEVLNNLDDNCNGTIDEGLVSITEINLLDFEIYPNPNSGIFKIQFENYSSAEICIQVFNLLGEIIYENNITMLDDITIDLSQNYAGLANIIIKYQDTVISKIIVITH